MISRRMFFGGVAGACWPRSECFVLEAIAAERMPQRVVVKGVESAAFFELRDYGADAALVAPVLWRLGIRPVLRENGRFLFAFETLSARERAWREIATDPEWTGLSAVLREITVFRTARMRGRTLP